MVYVYEALALVLVGVILGTIVGTWLQHARYSNDWSSIMIDVWLRRLGDRDISHVAVQHVQRNAFSNGVSGRVVRHAGGYGRGSCRSGLGGTSCGIVKEVHIQCY